MTPLPDYVGRHPNAYNALHALIVLAAVGLPAAIAAGLLWGGPGLAVVLAVGALMYASAPRLPSALLIRLYRARPLPKTEGGQIAYILEQLAKRAGAGPAASIYLIPSITKSAFVSGSPRDTVILISEGLLRSLSLRELAGVLAHELSHARNNDLPLMALADLVTRTAPWLSYLALIVGIINLPDLLLGDSDIPFPALLLLYVTPAALGLVQLGLSRAREYDADADGALLTGDPAGLASALDKMERYRGSFWEDVMLPVPTRRIPFPSLLRSHPPTAERIRCLRALKVGDLPPPLDIVEEPMMSMVGFGPGTLQPRYRFPGVWF